MSTGAQVVHDSLARLEELYRPLDDLWAAKRGDPSRDAYNALGVALCALDDAREGLERAATALVGAAVAR